MSDRLPRTLVALGLFIVGGICTWFTLRELSTDQLVAPRGTITLERATTPEARARGLSGRSALAADSGMLFEFEELSTTHCLWMKDMQISLDMVWLDADKKVITIKHDARPESYPEDFCPDAPAAYALELNSGAAASLGIENGEVLNFK